MASGVIDDEHAPLRGLGAAARDRRGAGSNSSGADPRVLEAAQRGDPAACRTLVRQLQGSVHALIWRMLGTRARPALVEDLTQEAFLRVFRSLPRFRPEGRAKLSTWVLSIATRTAIDELRRTRPAPEPLPTIVDDPAQRPDVHAQRRSLGQAIAMAVDTLGPQLRATFVLRAYHELTHPEIAQALDVDIGTVKSRLHRARAALRAHLQEVRDDH